MNVWTSAVNLAVRLAEDDTAFDPTKVTPGPEGFIMTGVLALAVIGLGFVLVRRMRASSYRHDIRDQIEAELAAQEAGESADADGAEGTDGSGTDVSGTDASQK